MELGIGNTKQEHQAINYRRILRFMKLLLAGLLAAIVTMAAWMLIYPWISVGAVVPPIVAEPVMVTTVNDMTAKNAFSTAKITAHAWAKDATLLSARATWDPGTDFQSGVADWALVFYSPDQSATALISVVDRQATLINIREAGDNPTLANADSWHIDSPAIVDQILASGGAEFLRGHPGANLVLTLDLEGEGDWKGRFIHKETRRIFTAQIDAESGDIVSVQQSG